MGSRVSVNSSKSPGGKRGGYSPTTPPPRPPPPVQPSAPPSNQPSPQSEMDKDKLKGVLTSKVGAKPKEKTYSKAQLERWTSSINSLLTDEEGFEAFKKFLEAAESDPGEFTKYLDFYKECEDFREKCLGLEEEAKRIYETYLEVGSDKEVSTEGRGKNVEENIEGKDFFSEKSLFETCRKKAKDKLEIMLYANFCDEIKKRYKL